MYNEDEALFVRTFTSVIKVGSFPSIVPSLVPDPLAMENQNIQHLQSRTKSKTWGEGSWKKVVVCVISDGRAKINPRTLKILGLYGVFQDGVMKDEVDGKDVEGHVFEYTTQVVVDANGVVSGGIAPVQILFCLKEQNKSTFFRVSSIHIVDQSDMCWDCKQRSSTVIGGLSTHSVLSSNRMWSSCSTSVQDLRERRSTRYGRRSTDLRRSEDAVERLPSILVEVVRIY